MKITKSDGQLLKERIKFLEKYYPLLLVWKSNIYDNQINIEVQTNKPKRFFKGYKLLATISYEGIDVFKIYMEKRTFYLKQTNEELQKILGNKEKRKNIRKVQDQLHEINLQRKMDKVKETIAMVEIDDIGGELPEDTARY